MGAIKWHWSGPRASFSAAKTLKIAFFEKKGATACRSCLLRLQELHMFGLARVHYFAGELTGDEIRRVNRLKIKGKSRVYNNNNGVWVRRRWCEPYGTEREKRQLSFMTDICQAARCASCLCAASLSLSRRLQARALLWMEKPKRFSARTSFVLSSHGFVNEKALIMYIGARASSS